MASLRENVEREIEQAELKIEELQAKVKSGKAFLATLVEGEEDEGPAASQAYRFAKMEHLDTIKVILKDHETNEMAAAELRQIMIDGGAGVKKRLGVRDAKSAINLSFVILARNGKITRSGEGAIKDSEMIGLPGKPKKK